MSLALTLLGSFELRRDGLLVGDFRAQNLRALLTYLAVESDRFHERNYLCTLFWPNEPLQTAQTNLRQALHRLRQLIEPEGEEGRYLIISRHSVRLNSTEVSSDVSTFYDALQSVANHRHRSVTTCDICASRLREALRLNRGDLLPGFSLPNSERFEDWLQSMRERLHNTFSGLLDTLAAYHERRGEYTVALELLRRWVLLDPWHEDAHLRLITTLAHTGQRTLALRQFERYRAVLSQDLGIAPSPHVCTIADQLRNGTFPRPVTTTLRHAPVSTTTFVGRVHELARLVEQLNNPCCRLLTLTGLGGSGKTRLAIEVGRAACHSFADGAVFVSLVALQHAAEFPKALAHALGLSSTPSQPLLELLVEALQGRELLLILDNCEQVAELAGLLGYLLTAAPRLTVLATSRRPLDLRAEWVVPIDGLDRPIRKDEPVAPSSYAAGQLVLQVANQVQPSFIAGPIETKLIYECCELLDGIPLALELAATKLRTHTLAEVVTAIRENLNSLTTTMSDVAVRHRSLRAIFDWSWRLLTPDEQNVLARLSVFCGGFDLISAEAIVGQGAPLTRLLQQSLLRHDATGRYYLHEQIRQFAAEQLERLELEHETSKLHCTHYLSLAASYNTQMGGSQEGAIITRLHTDHDNLCRAWEHIALLPDYNLLSEAIPVFGQIYARYNLCEGANQFNRALAQLQPLAIGAEQARRHLLNTLVKQLQAIGRFDEAISRAHELLALAQAIGDSLDEASALLHLGDLAAYRRDFSTAWNHYTTVERLSAEKSSRTALLIKAHSLLKRAGLIDIQQLPVDYTYVRRAAEIYTALDVPLYESLALNRLGNQYRRSGHYGRSLEVRLRAADLLKDQGDFDVSVDVLNDLGETFLLLGGYQDARELFERALVIAVRLGMRRMEVIALEGLGRSLLHLGDVRLAAAHVERSLALDEMYDTRIHRGYHLTTQGYVAERSGNWHVAWNSYVEAVAWWENSQLTSDAFTEPRAGLVRIALSHGQLEKAHSLAEVLLPYLMGSVLQDAFEPLRVYLSCYQALLAAQDRRAEDVLRRAYELLVSQAAHISDAKLRNSFLNHIVHHRAICEASQVGPQAVDALERHAPISPPAYTIHLTKPSAPAATAAAPSGLALRACAPTSAA